MRKIMCAVMAALMLLSTGCASMLNRDYSSVAPHSATPTAEGDSNTIRVENYQELVNALIYLVNQGEESGSIRYSGEEADFKKLMDEACLEVKQEDPLGNYAVDYIKYSVTSIVGSYEADVQITYRRTREQVASIVDALAPLPSAVSSAGPCLPSPVRSFCASATLRRMRITSISWCGRPISPIRPRPWTSPRPRWLCTRKAASSGSWK